MASNIVQKVNTSVSPIAAFRLFLSSDNMKEIITDRIGDKREYFASALLDLASVSPKLLQCDPNAVVLEALKAAAMELPLNPALGIAFLIPYNEKGANGASMMTPHLQLGYKAFIQLGLRSGQFRHLNADCIYEGETVALDRIKGTMKVKGTAENDTVIGFFAYMQLINGFEKAIYMTPEQIHRHAKKYSKQYGYSSASEWINTQSKGAVGWKGTPIQMAIKTVLLQLKSYMPMSIEMQQAFSDDKSEVLDQLPDTTDANSKRLEIFTDKMPEATNVRPEKQPTPAEHSPKPAQEKKTNEPPPAFMNVL